MMLCLSARSLVAAASLGLAACGSGGNGGGSAADTTAPLATVAPVQLSISDATVITITFNERMDDGVGAWQVTGSLAGDSDGGSWSMTAVQDDTLSIRPTGGRWPIGSGGTLILEARDLAGNPAATINLSYDIYPGTLHYVDGTRPDDSGDGLSPATARRFVHTAVAAATPPATILVRAGDYFVDSGLGTQVILRERVSLYGGFNADFTARDPSLHISSIEDQSTAPASFVAPNRAIEGDGTGSAISDDTVIDGFTLKGSSQAGSEYGAAVVLFDEASPTLRNNRIHGGAGITPFGLYSFSASPTVTGNTIHGGTGTSTVYGVYNVFSLARIHANTIHAGNATTSSYGVFSAGTNGSSPTLHNNTIHGGGAPRSHGLIEYNASSVVRNNTIYGGTGALWSIAVLVEGDTIAASPGLDNNILFTRSGAGSTCIAESVPGAFSANPATLRNNNLFNCLVPYLDVDAGCPGNGDLDADSSTCTVVEMNALADIGTVSGNVSVDPLFADVDGADNDINTLEDNDWRFSASSPAGLTAGGLNGRDQLPAWGFVTDHAGVARPASGMPWAIGAFEPE